MKIDQSLNDFNPREFGFKSGLEVHHQLLTEKKLFCRCPAGLYSDHFDATALRHMRPTLSELGEYDGTALMEFKTKKDILYRLNKETVCTYEMDDNPPFLINRQAVDIAIEIALLLNCSIVGELHVARKQYLDGSIPAGFQRTAIVGVNGWIPYKDKKIGIIQLALEEDACREVSDEKHLRIYATDRLSMPLIEVVTAPDMLDPTEIYEVGVIIGHLLRATGKVRRGIGSVRQDVNASITGGTRVEIKGVPRLPLIPRLVHYEAYRQHQLLELKDLLKSRGITSDNLNCIHFDLTKDVTHDLIKKESFEDFGIGAIVFPKMKGVFSHPIGPKRTFADDVTGRVRVIACLHHNPMLVHSDDNTDLILNNDIRQKLIRITGKSVEDLMVMVWGEKKDVKTALNEIEIRCNEAISTGVPNETRQVLSSGETEFERILPGPNRMYPDTDSPPLELTFEAINKIRSALPERPWEREKRLREFGLSQSLIDSLIISPRIDLFYSLAEESGVPPVLAATVLGELLVHIRRMGADDDGLSDEILREMFNLFSDGKISREAFRLMLEEFARTGKTNWSEMYYCLGNSMETEKTLMDFIKKVINLNVNIGPKEKSIRKKYIMGEIMKNLKGWKAGKEISEFLNTVLA